MVSATHIPVMLNLPEMRVVPDNDESQVGEMIYEVQIGHKRT